MARRTFTHVPLHSRGRTMTVAQLGELEMFYESQGEGQPLVLIQGYTCSHRFWDQMAPDLAKRFRVIRFDNRGIGFTRDDGRSFSLDTMAADTAALIEHLRLVEPILVGHSMGGMIVQTLLEQRPHVCGKCVILNSTRSFSRQATMLLESLLALRQADVDFDFLVDATLRLLSGLSWLTVPSNIDSFKTALKCDPAAQSLADQARQLQALKTFDATSYDTQPRHPVLVVSSTEDLLTPVADGRQLAQALNAHLEEIRTGHPSVLEAHETLARLIVNFLAA
ncbi:alpha/beta hydrolase [Trinickia soli]|uniref:Alpha/beta hydrolase n=2 Tax=Trinickia soli TaxID=380675 RepID=A0A2N7W645_9BURK|nr:alpha/beta hydrolase [Trinickia soli]